MTKDDKIKELLSVLDMPEEEQHFWLKEHYEEFDIPNHPAFYPLKGFPRTTRFFLADLAFRLRGEVKKLKNGRIRWFEGVTIVSKSKRENFQKWYEWAEAIDYVVTALIAKVLNET